MIRRPTRLWVLDTLKGALLFAIALYLAHAFTAGHDNIVGDVESSQENSVQSSPQTAYEKHAEDCWTGDAPADVEYPGHVIWQHPDGTTVYSARLVDDALDAIFGDGDLAGSPIAFCR